MILIADEKRRVVLPKPAQPGDAFQCLATGDHFVLVRMTPASRLKPPVADKPLGPETVKGVDLDEPAFAALRDEGVD